MKLPRDLSGRDLARALSAFGYEITRQTGSHLARAECTTSRFPITNIFESVLSRGILTNVADHFLMSRGELLSSLFG